MPTAAQRKDTISTTTLPVRAELRVPDYDPFRARDENGRWMPICEENAKRQHLYFRLTPDQYMTLVRKCEVTEKTISETILDKIIDKPLVAGDYSEPLARVNAIGAKIKEFIEADDNNRKAHELLTSELAKAVKALALVAYAELQVNPKRAYGTTPEKKAKFRKLEVTTSVKTGIRVTPKEFSQIQDKSLNLGITVSELIRKYATGAPVCSNGIKETFGHLRRIYGLAKLAVIKEIAPNHYITLAAQVLEVTNNLKAAAEIHTGEEE